MIETVLPARLRPPGAGRAAAAVARAHDSQSGASLSNSIAFHAGRGGWLAALAAFAKDLSTPMLSRLIAAIIDVCTRHIWPIILISAVLAAASGTYAARHFAINADVTKLIAPDLPWRQRELAYQSAFTQGSQLIVAVVDAPTPELATAAANALVGRLEPDKQLFQAVSSVATSDFIARNRFLYLPTEQVAGVTGQLSRAAPLITQLTSDPSLRGLAQGMSLALTGVQAGQVTLDGLARPLNMSADTIEKVLTGEPARFSWYCADGRPARERVAAAPHRDAAAAPRLPRAAAGREGDRRGAPRRPRPRSRAEIRRDRAAHRPGADRRR